jgi:8-oxo-dGTP pyrophosphatase MutT (NUDIX family)
MEVQHRHSYGVIPLIGTSENWKLLLIDQKDRALAHYWTFPKGTPEAGEEPMRTAIRETFEEVGILCDAVDEQFSYTDEYAFEQDGVRIEKRVTYYVGRAPSEEVTLQEEEVQDARWVTPEEAEALMTFDDKVGILEALKQSGAIERLLK